MLLNPLPGSEDKFMRSLLDKNVGVENALTKVQLTLMVQRFDMLSEIFSAQ